MLKFGVSMFFTDYSMSAPDLGQALEAAGRRDEAQATFTRVSEVAPLSQESKDAKAALERLKTGQ